jgi:fluoride ion exporter CrcB/FEX
MVFCFQKGAKVDKPMTDGRTSVVKAMENSDMPMIDILLGADKDQNFSTKSGFVYEMTELYQRDDRGLMCLHVAASCSSLTVCMQTLEITM